MERQKLFFVATLLWMTQVAWALETIPEGLGGKIIGLEVFPRAIELAEPYAYRQVLLTAELETGERVDVTRMARVQKSAPIVDVSPMGVVRSRKDGSGELEFTLGNHSVTVPVAVNGQKDPWTASFVQDVMPVLSKIGCNGGTCHGAAKGKNGFKLSLRGNDPGFDHRALTDDLGGRRFNRAAPDQSLFLLKTSGAVPHGGGVVTEPGKPYYEILRSWVAGGVKLDLEKPRVVQLELRPENPVIPLPGMKQQVAVIAHYADGVTRDVTTEAFVETSNTEITDVSKQGLVTAKRRGEAAIMARYEGNYAATQFFVMGDRSGFAWKEIPQYNIIDNFVYRKLKKVKTLPSEICTDAEFLRRVYLDLTGLPPRPKEVRTFLMDSRDSRLKREETVDRLLGSAEFVEHFTNKWADLLQVNSKFLGSEGAAALRQWIRRAVASNMPYDKFVYDILTATGSTQKNPPASYFKVLREPDLVMENTTQLFLGVRFNCNKCHDHPFERWTQANHWETAAFFAQVGRKNQPGSKLMPKTDTVHNPPAFEEVISDKNQGEITAPYSGKIAQPAFPYEHDGGRPKKGTRREQFAQWLTAAENPYFAASYVNRVFSYFLGAGLIEPVDDIRASNPPSNPELLGRLTKDFVDSGLDVRKLIRLICTSRVYQHSIRTNKWNYDDTINYSHALARRLPAETLYDAVHLATGSISRLPGVRVGTRAAELPGPEIKLPDAFLDLFGRPPRESSCECERTTGMSLGQALSLVNGPTIANAVNDPENAFAHLTAVEDDPERILDELYISILCRPPTEKEQTEFGEFLDVNSYSNIESLSPEDHRALETRFAAFIEKHRPARWMVLEPEILKSQEGATLAKQPDGSILASGKNPDRDTYTLVMWTDLEAITGFRLEVIADDSLPRKGPGRAESGDFLLTELRITAAPGHAPSRVKEVKLQNAQATFSAVESDVSSASDGDFFFFPAVGWAIGPQTGRRHEAIFETAANLGKGDTLLTVQLHQLKGGKHTLGRFRLSATTTERPLPLPPPLPREALKLYDIDRDQWTAEQYALMFRHYIRADAEMAKRIRLSAARDMAWALINSPAFLFNR